MVATAEWLAINRLIAARIKCERPIAGSFLRGRENAPLPKPYLESIHPCGSCRACKQHAKTIRWFHHLVCHGDTPPAICLQSTTPVTVKLPDGQQVQRYEYLPQDQAYFAAAVPAVKLATVVKQVRAKTSNYVTIHVQGKTTALVVAIEPWTFSSAGRAATPAHRLTADQAVDWLAIELAELYDTPIESEPGQKHRPVTTGQAWNRRSSQKQYHLIARPTKAATPAGEFAEVLSTNCGGSEWRIVDDQRMHGYVREEPSADLLRKHGRTPRCDLDRSRALDRLLQGFATQWEPGPIMVLVPLNDAKPSGGRDDRQDPAE